MKLTPAIISATYGGGITELTEVNFKDKGYEELDDISVCVDLKRVDLSNNKLSNIDGLSDNKFISWLNVSHNSLETMQAVKKLTKLSGI